MECGVLKMGKLFITLGEIVRTLEAYPITVYDDKSYEDVKIDCDRVYRLGLELLGSASDLGPGKLVVTGVSERDFLEKLFGEEKKLVLDDVFSNRFEALFVTSSIVPEELIVRYAKKYKVFVFGTEDKSSAFMSELSNLLEERLEPTITRPAGFVSIYGEGVLITGESGVGKSEVSLELIHRGHKFVSDDLTEIRKISTRTLIGSSPGNISQFIEVRGIGIVNIQQLFGVNSIKLSETINMLVHFEVWDKDRTYDRLGLEEKYVEILGVKVPYVSIPVKPGKNLAVIVEVAAMNNRLKRVGLGAYNALIGDLSDISDLTPHLAKEAVFVWNRKDED